MKIRTLIVTLVLFVGLTSIATAGMNRQKRAGACIGAAQSTSQQTCANNGAQNQKRNGQNCQKQCGNGQGRNRQGGKGMGRNGQGGNGQHRFAQGANKQNCNCDGTCINQ